MLKSKHPKDKYFKKEVLREALIDLKEYGLKIDTKTVPIMETWILVWRRDTGFKAYIKAKTKFLKRNRKRRHINVKIQRKRNATLHLHLHNNKKKDYEKIKKVRKKISVRR